MCCVFCAASGVWCAVARVTHVYVLEQYGRVFGPRAIILAGRRAGSGPSLQNLHRFRHLYKRTKNDELYTAGYWVRVYTIRNNIVTVDVSERFLYMLEA